MKGLAGQIALAAIAVAVVVGLVLTVGTLTFSSRSFAELMVEHGETLAAAQAMFQESVARFFVAALAVAALAGIGLALFVGRRVAAPLREVSAAARLIARGDHAVRVQPRGQRDLVTVVENAGENSRIPVIDVRVEHQSLRKIAVGSGRMARSACGETSCG